MLYGNPPLEILHPWAVCSYKTLLYYSTLPHIFPRLLDVQNCPSLLPELTSNSSPLLPVLTSYSPSLQPVLTSYSPTLSSCVYDSRDFSEMLLSVSPTTVSLYEDGAYMAVAVLLLLPWSLPTVAWGEGWGESG